MGRAHLRDSDVPPPKELASHHAGAGSYLKSSGRTGAALGQHPTKGPDAPRVRQEEPGGRCAA